MATKIYKTVSATNIAYDVDKTTFKDAVGANTYIIEQGAKATISGSTGGDTIALLGAASDYTVKIVGKTVTFKDGDGVTVTVNFKSAGTNTVQFADGSAALVFTSAGHATLGTVALKRTLKDLSATATLDNTVSSIDTYADAETDSGAAANLGQTFTLTTGIDTMPGLVGSAGTTGTDNDDIIVATLDAVAATETLTALDTVNGGNGNDTLNILNAVAAAAALPAGITVSSVETVNVRSAHDVGATGAGNAFDVSDFTGTTTLNVTQAAKVFVEAAATTDINVSSATDVIQIDGGKNVVVTDATASKNITIGATTVNAGTITVTDTAQGTGAIAIDGGTNVAVTATATELTGTITVGDTTNAAAGVAVATDVATGTINVTQNLVGDGTGVFTGGAIKTEGGSTVNITVNANSTATGAATNDDITVGAITVNGSDVTTTVTVTQNDNAVTFTSAEVAEVADREVVTFVALATGESVTVDGLTFTASKALTAAEVAAAFADLSVDDTQDNGGKVANGTYTGAFNTTSDWTSAAASGATVTFTGTDSSATAMTISDTAAAGNVTSVATAGTAASGGVESTNATVFGAVTVSDSGDDVMTTVTVDGYATASSVTSDALETLTLKNSAADAVFTVTNTVAASALVLNVEDITSTGTAKIDLDGSAGKITDLTINANTAASEFILTAAGVTDLTVNAAVALTLTATTDITASENIDINGAGAVNLGDISTSVALDSFNAAGNNGGVTATIETEINGAALTGSITEYVFSEGNDVVTLSNDVIETIVTLGAGDDTLKLATATGIADVVATLNGGTGTNTIDMTAADAETLSGDATFEAKMSNFSKLSVRAASSQEVVDLANMDDMSYVVTAGSTGTAQVSTVTVGGVIEIGDIFTVTINGTDYSFTATATTIANVVAGLQALVNADANVAAVDASPDLTITASIAGVPFTVAVATTEAAGAAADAQTIAVVATTANAYGLTLNHMANNGTVEITSTGTVLVSMTDATSLTADVLNVVTKVAGDVDAGALTVNDVETVNVTATDTTPINTTTGAATINTSTLALFADAATTVVVDGNAHVTLTTVADALETVNAVSMTGNLTYTASLADLVVNAGSGADVLTANADSVTLNAGNGANNFTVNAGADLVTLTGGTGVDTFNIAGASTTESTYAVISAVTSGDTIKFTGADSFASAAVTLSAGATVTSQALMDKAINDLGANDMGWFQYNGNTFIVMDAGANGAAGFVDAEDMVVMITGLVDLSTASYNATSNTLEIA